MKKVISSLLVASMLFCASVAKADNLTVEQAKAIGAYYMAYQTGIEKIGPENLVLNYQFYNPELDIASAYVFNVNGCGWIIVGATTVVDPIIAFSEEGSVDMNNIPDNMRWWLTNYTDVVADIQCQDSKNDYPDCEEYITLVNQKLGNGAKAEKIVLMSTKWDQGNTRNPTYNYYCPQVNGRYCVTGCVATAVSQICRYYRFPVKPKGTANYTWDARGTQDGVQLIIKLDTVQFDYSLMPNALTDAYDNIIVSMDEVREVAKLNYCLGVAVKMDYHPDGSGAYYTDVLSAMRYKFKYQLGTNRQRNGTNDTNYINTLRRHLLNGDVVYMHGVSSTGSGADAGGHAWVVCGYQQQDETKYYMNWGWGGTGNAFYNLATNNMYISSQGYNFNVSQGCLFGMLPPEDSNIYHSHVAIQEVDKTILGSAYPNPAALSVSLPYTTERVADMQVYSIDGKLVATRRVQPGTGEVTLRVDALPQGVYIYRLNSQNGKFIVR